jgi:hypothetical protein
MNWAMPATSRSFTYPGTRSVLAMRKGGMGLRDINLEREMKFSRVFSFETPQRA